MNFATHSRGRRAAVALERGPGPAVALALPLALAAACGAPPPATNAEPAGAEYVYVWTADADEQDADFLAVLDARPASPTYGHVLSTVPVEGRANWPHHTEYELGTSGTLFANGWNTGRTFVFDVSRPEAPAVRTSFGAAGGFSHPHSYARLPNGNVLATFQSLDGGVYHPPGGLVELDGQGRVVRAASGATPGLAAEDTWPYSLLVLPDLDRVILTHTRMGTVDEWLDRVPEGETHGHAGRDTRPTHVQVWRLSDLSLLHTLALPPQAEGHNEHPAEPRRMANGEVFVNTFSCGLYRLTGLDTDAPGVEPVLYSPFEGSRYCAVPVTIGDLWIQPSATEDAIVAWDLSDPARPREVSRLTLDAPFQQPHWLALDPSGRRLVVSADMPPDLWVMVLDLDPATGRMSIDERFRDPGAARPGVRFDRTEWPHGATGEAYPHGAVFSAPPAPPGPR